MTAPAVLRVDISSLSLGLQLGSGGQGRVVAVSGFRIDGKWPAVLKIYSQALALLDAAVLEKIVSLPRQLSPGDRQWLLDNTAWPAAIAENQGVVSGFLMRMVPEDFYFSYQTQTRGAQRQLADTAFLLNPDSYVSSAGLTVSDSDRLALLRSVALTLSRLHVLGAAAGDLSPKNVLFRLHPSPGCFLIDCDALQLNGETVFTQVETPDWEVPYAEPKATPATDAYKLGLLAIRLFARDQSSRDPAAITAVSPQLGRLAVLSQDHDPARRPPPSAWVSALTVADSPPPAPPIMPEPAVPAPARFSVPVPPLPDTATIAPMTSAPAPAIPPPWTGPERPSRTRWPALIGAAAAAFLVLVSAGIFGFETFSHHGSPHNNPGPTPPAEGGTSGPQNPSPTPSPSPQRVKVGLVTISPGLAGAPGATAVAAMLNTYFSGIDQQNYQQAASVFDPSGSFNPGDPSQVQNFANGVATTRDGRVVLVGLRPSGSQPVRKAEVTFRSHQAAGYGPSDAPSATCTNWDITYALTQPAGRYLIDKVISATDSGC
jgi:hypothetical protein